MVNKRLTPKIIDNSSQPRHEILAVAETVAREKGIEREEVLTAMEQAIQKVGNTKYGYEHDIRASINRTTGEVKLFKFLKVVETITNPYHEILLEDVKVDYPEVQLDGFIEEELPPVEFGRVAAQSARQVITQKVRDAERARQFEEYKDRVGQIISGLIKRVEFGNVIFDLGRAEGILRKDDTLPREVFRVGDRIRAYISDIKPEARGPMIILSRTHPGFMAKLFEQEVPEIYDGLIEIKSVARDPGSRAKIAVYTGDHSIDPVGACVGMRGSRVQAIVNELQGEKVDIVLWSANPATFVVNALAPAEVVKVVIDEESHRVDVVVGEDQLSLAIGRRGQNVRLATQLTSWNIDILTEEQETARRSEEFNYRTSLFIEALDVDEIIAQLLATEGFTSILEIVHAPISELASIEGFDEDVAQELINRAKTFLEQKETKDLERCKEMGVENDLLILDGLTSEMIVKLAEQGIKTLDDFADLASEEVIEILGRELMDIHKANEVIMKARAHWFNEND